MHGCTRFTSLDIKSAYWQIQIHPDDRNKTAFVVPGHGIHRYKRMAFGLQNAPATFQFLIEKVLPVAKGGKLDTENCCFAYLDDILIPSKTVDENLDYLEIVLQALIKNNFKLHPKKCKFLATELEYLGHVISASGIGTSPAKTQKIRDWPRLHSQKDVRAFLGIC